MSCRYADTRPRQQRTSCPAAVNPQPNKRHVSPVSPLCPVHSVHHHSSCITDPTPISCNKTRPRPPGPDLQCATQSVSYTVVLQLPKEDLKKEQQQDSILSEVISWKAKGQKIKWLFFERHCSTAAAWRSSSR